MFKIACRYKDTKGFICWYDNNGKDFKTKEEARKVILELEKFSPLKYSIEKV